MGKKEIPLGWILFVIVIGIVFYFNYTFSVSENVSDLNSSYLGNDKFLSTTQKHWGYMPITYQRINQGGCEGVQFDKMADAFKIIENSTGGVVSFVEVEQNPDIQLVCLDRAKLLVELKEALKDVQVCKNVTFDYRKEVLRHYSSDDGLDRNTHVIINTDLLEISSSKTIYQICYGDINSIESLEDSFLKEISFDLETLGHAQPIVSGEVITEAKIYFFKTGQGWSSCIFPTKEIHEILHTFSFGHSYEPYWDPQWGYTDWSYVSDTMFPKLYCDQQKKLEEKYISCLKKIYSGVGDCSEVNFMEWGADGSLIPENNCEEGWYPVEGTEWCCPEPDMIIVDDYYFNAPLKQQFNPETYTKQQLLFDRLKKSDYHVILCKRKKRVDDEGNESHIIKEDDIRLAL